MSMKNIGGTQAASLITNIQPNDIQPNAVDLRVGMIFRIDPDDIFAIDEEKKQHRKTHKVFADEEEYFNLTPGHYEVVMENEVKIAAGEAGWVVARSTLNRNGVYITSGIFDSGYEGAVGGVMHVVGGPMRVKVGTRIAQFVLVDAETVKQYDGDYGKGKAHDEKKYK